MADEEHLRPADHCVLHSSHFVRCILMPLANESVLPFLASQACVKLTFGTPSPALTFSHEIQKLSQMWHLSQRNCTQT